MSFNKKQRDWNKWKKKNQNFLNKCGIPEEIFETEERWFLYLEHGYDEIGYYKKIPIVHDINTLTKSQRDLLINFLSEQYKDNGNSNYE